MKQTKILLVGDICIEEEVPKLGEDLNFLVRSHDLVSCNLEGSIRRTNKDLVKKAGPSLGQSHSVVKLLKDSGFNIFNLANNHIIDCGIEALKETLNGIGKDNCVGAGTDINSTYKALVKNVNGIKVGFISLAEWGFGVLDEVSQNGYAWVNHSKVNELVRETKKEVDYLIVQVHAGIEDVELPLPIWKDRYRELLDLGADLIVGHHPHVPQGWEEYKGRKIYYSLGNFYMRNRKIKEENNYVLSVTLNGKASFEVIPITRVNSLVEILKDKKFVKYLDSISKKIVSENYDKEINELSAKLWEERYKDFYSIALNRVSFKNSLRNNLKALKNLVLNKDIDNCLLLHNLAIESHRYIVERYLKSTYIGK